MHIKSIATAFVLGLTLSAAQQLFADEMKPSPTAASKLSEAVVVEGIVSPRDSASGLATGKRQHKPITILKPLDIPSPLEQRGLNPQPLPPKSGTDLLENELSKAGLNPQPLPPAASGLPTGKRMHKPINIIGPVDNGGLDPLSKQGLNPQPLPPKALSPSLLNPADARMLNPQPLPPKEIDRVGKDGINKNLQQHMDVQTKADSAMSGLAKKSSDTSNSIIRNMK